MKNNFLILFLAFSIVLTGQDVTEFSLEEAIAFAMNNSKAVKNSQINISDAEQQIVETRAMGIPQVNATVGYNYFIELPTSLIPAQFLNPIAPADEFAEVQFGTSNNLEAKIQATALLFDGSYFVGLRAAREARSYAAEQLAQTKQELGQRVKDAYFPSLILQTSQGTLEKNIINLKKLRVETNALVEAGFAEQLDLDRLDLSIANLETELENLGRQIDLAKNYLKFQMGYPIDKDITLTDNVEALLQEVTSEDLIGTVNYQSRADYRVMDRVIELNRLNVDLQKQAYYPSVAGFASYSYTGQGNNLFKDPAWFPTALAGLQLNVPIFSGLQRNAKVERAKFQLDIIENQKDELARGILLEVQNARGNYNNSLRRVELQKKNIALAQKIYDTAQIKYKEGVGSSLEINQAETSLFNTQQNYDQALFDLLTSKSALEKALGK